MTNPFARLSQPFSSRISAGDLLQAAALTLVNSLTLRYRYRIKVAVASLLAVCPFPKQAPAHVQLKARVAQLSHKELSIARLLSTISWLAGLAAIVAGCTSNQVSDSPTPIPTASSVSPEEIQTYAKAVLAIEPIRQTAYSDIQKANGDEKLPDVTCTKADTITALAKSTQDIAVNYCNKAKEIGEKQGLTIPRFNEITATAQSNSELRKRIQNELVRLQR